jgi:hypothetical protein
MDSICVKITVHDAPLKMSLKQLKNLPQLIGVKWPSTCKKFK